MSRTRTFAYCGSTVLVAGAAALAGGLYLSAAQPMVDAFARLGYPPHLRVLLGTAKLLGAAALLAPRLPVAKEWAYAGFAVCYVAASTAHAAAGDGAVAVAAPLAFLGLLVVSYTTRPRARRPSAAPVGSPPGPLSPQYLGPARGAS